MKMKGFTLIEVLVALLIVSVSLVAMMSTMRHSADFYTRLQKRYWAQTVVWNQAVRYSKVTQSTGSTYQAGNTWYWSYQEKKLGLPGVTQIETHVRENKSKKTTRH